MLFQVWKDQHFFPLQENRVSETRYAQHVIHSFVFYESGHPGQNSQIYRILLIVDIIQREHRIAVRNIVKIFGNRPAYPLRRRIRPFKFRIIVS